MEDNLLTTGSGIVHDGAAVTQNEEMSPSCERLIVYLWLNLIDKRLPAYVSRIYAHDLQSKSLKDVQPHICQALDSLLAELDAQEDIQVNRSFQRTRTPPVRQRQQQQQQPFNPQRHDNNRQQNSTNKQKSCTLCKLSGRPHAGHDIAGCWFLSRFDKLEITRALRVDVDADEDFQVPSDSPEGEDSEIQTVSADVAVAGVAVTRRVSTRASPFICTFYKHYHCKIVIDTGATSSMVSLHFVKRVGLEILPTQQGARQMDKSPVNVRGEVKFYVSFGDLQLEIEALITDSLDCDVLGGVPFGKANQVVIDFPNEKLFIMGQQFPWGTASNMPVHQV